MIFPGKNEDFEAVSSLDLSYSMMQILSESTNIYARCVYLFSVS